MVAVCKAERGKPAANISWSHMGNIVERLFHTNDFFTVESRLELLEKTEPENLNCTIKHPYWKEEQILVPKPIKGQVLAEWLASFYVFWVNIYLLLLFCANYNFVIGCDMYY